MVLVTGRDRLQNKHNSECNKRANEFVEGGAYEIDAGHEDEEQDGKQERVVLPEVPKEPQVADGGPKQHVC